MAGAAVVVSVDPDRLRAQSLTPQDVVSALTAGNVIVPAGNLYVKDEMPLVPTNTVVRQPGVIDNIPLVPGRNVYIREVAQI